VGQKEGKRPLGILSRKWKDNLKRSLREIAWSVMYVIHLAQDTDQ
jgi:hypothetical protein